MPSMEGIEYTNNNQQFQFLTPSNLKVGLGEYVNLVPETLDDMIAKPRFQPEPAKSTRGRKKKSAPSTITRPAGITKMLRNGSPPSTRTRSRNVAKFFELGHDNQARPLRKP